MKFTRSKFIGCQRDFKEDGANWSAVKARRSRPMTWGVTAAAVAATLGTSGSASAFNYEVSNQAADGNQFDGVCSLREAVLAATLRRQIDTCPPGDVGFNEIRIVGGPSVVVELTRNETIEIPNATALSIKAELGPGFRQNIRGRGTRFIVRPGGRLELYGLSFHSFTNVPFQVMGGVVPGRAFVRGQLDANNIEIRDNQVPSTVNTGGIFVDSGQVLLNNVLIHFVRGIRGAALSNSNGIITLNHVSVYDNHALQGGGGLFQTGTAAQAWIYNSTFSGNRADFRGSGMEIAGGTANIDFSTITANHPSGSGTGWGIHNSGGTVNARRSIVAGNSITTSASRDCAGTITSGGYNLLQRCSTSTVVSTDVTGVTASLGALTAPIGQDWWMTPAHTPTSTSRAVNAIPVAQCTDFYDDQQYHPRDNRACDIGSIERQ